MGVVFRLKLYIKLFVNTFWEEFSTRCFDNPINDFPPEEQ